MTNAVSNRLVGREGVQYFDDGSEPPNQFIVIVPLDFVKRPGLFLEYMDDRIGAIAAIKLGGEWVVGEIFPGLFTVLLQGSIEKNREGGGGEAV